MRWLLQLSMMGVLASGLAARADTTHDIVYINLSGMELQRLLQDWGYRAELTTDDQGDPMIKSSTLGVSFYVYYYGCDDHEPKRCMDIQISAGLDLADPSELELIDDWNENKRFGKAYLDEEGDPFLEMNVNIEGGITEEALHESFRWWETALGEFLDHVGWR